MSTKIKTITLHPLYDCGQLIGYRVGRITDSLEFTPGDTIKKPEAEQLCDSKHWKVTVAPMPN